METERNLGQLPNLRELFTSELSPPTAFFFLHLFSYWKENKVCNYIPRISIAKQIYKRAFLTEKEREERVQNCPTQGLDIYLRWLTWKLAGCLISEAHSGYGSLTTHPVTTSYQGQPGQSSPVNSDRPQLRALDQALHRQKNALPDHKGDCKDLLLLLSPSTQLLQVFSYHLYDRNPIISVLPAVTILGKSLSMINADSNYRECLICLFLMISLHASFFQALWNSFPTLED